MIERETVGSTADALGSWVLRLLPDTSRAERLAAALRRELGQDVQPITADGCRRIEQVCHRHSRHLTLTFDEAGSFEPDCDRPTGWPPYDVSSIQQRGGGVTSVSRYGEVGVLRIDSLEPWEHASHYVRSATGLLTGCRGVVLDNRRNGGGEMDTLAALAGVILGQESTFLATVTSKNKVDQLWTPLLGDAAAREGLPAAVVISQRTYSSGEALAYILQNRGIPAVGQRTPGAADHVVPVRVSRHVEALVPFAVVADPVTDGNWEGVGVGPDVETAPGEELAAAIALVESSIRERE
ncbi:S41 family peptidase [Micromonospora sp. NPDC000089]|uniref:S41 family peptidase n=1 Tax=unclassified Micromonospora TaxID=2617518 RepID=UPI0036766A53